MNRRSFISTLTALAGVVLAKIKAPAAAISPEWRRGVATIAPTAPITAVRKTLDGLVVFSKSKVWEYKDGWREWKHPISQRYGRLLTLNENGYLVDTCTRCAAQAIPGYELICCSEHAAYCTCSNCSSL